MACARHYVAKAWSERHKYRLILTCACFFTCHDDKSFVTINFPVGVGASLAPTTATLRRTGAVVTAMAGPPMTVGAEKNATTKVRFPQRRSICWNMQSARTDARGRGEQRNDATATDDDGNDGGVIEEWRRTGGRRLLTRPGGQSTWLPVVACQYPCMGSG